jgi:hypothetical protein
MGSGREPGAWVDEVSAAGPVEGFVGGVDAATIIPSTDSGVRTATQPGSPCSSTSRCICR